MLMTHFNVFRHSLLLTALAAGLGMSPAVSFSAPAAAAPGPSAHWVERKLDYTYMGFTSKYSCDGLEDNVRQVLLALGARKADLKIHSLGCTRFNGPEPFPGVSASFWVLEPLTPDQVSKVGDNGANASQWQSVDLTRLNGAQWDQGQCELLEQMKQKVLPLFTSRNVDFHSSCFPHSVSLGEIQFKADVLRPAPATGTAPAA
jgi:hypothetical protein